MREGWQLVATTARNVAAVIGAGYLLKTALRELVTLLNGFRAYFLSPWGILAHDLTKYGEWAVVTGASEGIGRGYALELARRGLNVVLMSRSEEKLLKVAGDIKSRYPGRETLVVPVDFTGGLSVYTHIAEKLEGLDIGILINNVGLSYEHPAYFLEVPEQRLFDIVKLNCQATVHMTRLLLPKLLLKGGGVIVNLSTIGAVGPCECLAVYVASKVFVNYFSDSLRHEYGHRGISIQTVMPGLVATAMSKVRRVRWRAPSAESYAKAAVATIGVQGTTFGCWAHAVEHYIIKWMPSWVYQRLAGRQMKSARVRLLQRKAQRTPGQITY